MRANPNHDRAVCAIYLVSDKGERLVFSEESGLTAKLFTEFHGDHDEDWVCVYNASGSEVERYNARNLLSIEWKA